MRACTSGALELTDGELAVHPEKCIGCGTCAAACPTSAIEERTPTDAELTGALKRSIVATKGHPVIACEKASTLSDEQSAVVLDLLGKLGAVVELDTSLLFVGGTVGGCAPAFVAMAIEALGDAAVKHGIPRADAYRIVSQMVLGTAKLQLATGQHPAAMKDAVCSPGGATIKGVVALEDAGMRSALVKAIDATLQ